MSLEFVTPITTKTTFSSGKVITLVVVLAILIGVFLFFYWKQNEVQDAFDNNVKMVDIAIHNTTPTQHFLDIPTKVSSSRRVTIPPYSSDTIQVPVGRAIKSFSHLPTGEQANDMFQVTDQELLSGNIAKDVSGARNFVITQSGVFPERVLSREVQLVNSSKFPIMFVEKVRDFDSKRWSSEIIPPMSYITKDLVAPNTIYNVVHPTKESSPLVSTATPLKLSKMEFDGHDINIS